MTEKSLPNLSNSLPWVDNTLFVSTIARLQLSLTPGCLLSFSDCIYATYKYKIQNLMHFCSFDMR